MSNVKSQINKVLFVASGNKGAGTVSSFVQSQFDSLKAEGLAMLMFPIRGKGWKNYLKAVFALRKVVKREHPDIIHAHYSTCGFVASLATLCLCRRPKIVVSILGSFPRRNAKWRRVRWAISHLWDGALTKSARTRNQLGLDLPVIPNGVNLDIFHPMDQTAARKQVGFETNDQSPISNFQSPISNHKYIVWCSHPTRPEKNWPLAEAAVAAANQHWSFVNGYLSLNNKSQTTNHKPQISLVPVYDKTPQEVATFMNAADCLLLTSDSEGSPNVIKEAMACNCPIVTTNVGDVTERLANLDGCYVVEDDDCRFSDMNKAAALTAEALTKALAFGRRTEGNKRIMEDGLAIDLTAKKIIKWYEHCI